MCFSRVWEQQSSTKDLEVHLGLAAELLNISLELPLIGADGLAEALIVVEDCSEAERQHRGMLEAVCDDPGMVYARFLVQYVRGVMFADDDRQVAGGIEKDLISANAAQCFERNGLAMTGQLKEKLVFHRCSRHTMP